MKLQRLALVGAAFVGIAALSGVLLRAGSGDKRGELVVDGRKRTYAVTSPRFTTASRLCRSCWRYMGGLGEEPARRAHAFR
jgi:hypothetical protein